MPGVSIIAQNGFGDPNNSYMWSMDWFKGKLYVGTGRDEECMETATVQRYSTRRVRAYVHNPSPNTSAAPLRNSTSTCAPRSGSNTAADDHPRQDDDGDQAGPHLDGVRHQGHPGDHAGDDDRRRLEEGLSRRPRSRIRCSSTS